MQIILPFLVYSGLDVKARSKAMHEILTRIRVGTKQGSIKVKVFGDKVFLDEGMQ